MPAYSEIRRGKSRRATDTSELNDRLDEAFVDRHEIRPILVVDNNVGQTDEEIRFFVNRVRDTVPRRRNEEVTHIRAIDRSNVDPNFPTISQDFLLPRGPRLAFTAKKFLTLAQLFVLVLAHFFSTFFQYARHAVFLPDGRV